MRKELFLSIINEAEYVRWVITLGELFQRNSRIHRLLQKNLEARYEDKIRMDSRVRVSDIIPIIPNLLVPQA